MVIVASLPLKGEVLAVRKETEIRAGTRSSAEWYGIKTELITVEIGNITLICGRNDIWACDHYLKMKIDN